MDRQPPLGVIGAVLVFLPGFKGVFDRCLRADLARRQVDAPTAVEWVAFEDVGQLVEVDWEWPQHRRGAAAQLSIELVGQLIIAGPVSLPEQSNDPASEFGSSFDVRMRAALSPSPASCSASS